MWILNDGTEIEVEERSSGYGVYKKINSREEFWNLVDLLKGKDLSSFTIHEGAFTTTYSGMAFMGVSILEEDFDETTVRINFTEEILYSNSRLSEENNRLRGMLETASDKVEGYDILTGGV